MSNTAMQNSDNPVTFGDYIIYANGEFEMECKTRAGAKRCIAKIRRLGMNPTVRQHAQTADGRHMNVDCGTKNLKVRQWPTSAAPTQPEHAAILRPNYIEVRREEWPDGSSTVLSSAVRVF